MATKKNQPKNQRGKAASKAALAAVAGAVALSSEANAAEANLDQLTNIESLNNVTSLRRLDDGRLEVTLETGEIIILGEDDFVEQAGQFLIDAEALAANGGVTNIALLALGAGAIVGGVIAATGGDDDDDVDPELVLNVPSEAADSLVGTPGVDTIDGLGGDDSIDGLGGDDTLIGNAGNDTLIGGEGSDTLLGGTGSDTLTGNAGFDTLDGGAGSDALSGGAGDDTLVVDLADTLIDGGDGSDTLDLSTLDSGVRVDLDVNTPNPGPASQIGVIGQPDDGIEILDLENVIGTDFDDTILGNNEINNLQGGAGNDAIHSFAGVDTIDGGEGIDTALFSAGAGVIVDLDETGSGQAFVNVDGEAGAESDFFFNFENVNGSNNIGSANGGNDILSGNSGVNVLNGQAGDDILDGEGGADTLIGGDGNDTLIADLEDVLIDGGEGVDTLDLSALTDGVRVDLDVNTPNPGPASQDGVIGQPEDGIALVDVENIIGSQGDDVLLGNNEINVIEGGAGNDSIHSFAGVDTIDGGEGIDTALFSAGAGVIVDLDETGSGQAFVNVDGEAGAESDFFFNFENVNGSNNTGSANGGNDILTGNSQDNVLNGQAGDDILNGEGGADTLIGGDGDDLIISDALDTVDGGEGNDTIDFSGITQSDPAIFGPFDGVIVDLDVNSAGPAGEQSQNGGILNAPPGAVAVDGVVPADNILQEIDNVENVIGSDFNDGLFGNNEVNVLSAGAGNDSVHGFAGDDFLAGGEGTDTVLFVAAPDDITVDLTAQVSQEDFDAAFEAGTLDELETATTGPAGENVLSGFENVTAGVGNDTLIGNDADNVLNGNVGDDFLVGGLGNDTLIGGEGSDTADFSDIDVPVEIVVDAEGNGTATRETGFSIEVTDAEVNALNGLSDADFVSEAVAGNIYFNVHTADFTDGEIRGQLGVVSDVTDEETGVRTIVLEGGLDASQEPDPTSDSEATGFATLTITVDADGNATYSSTLDITGLATSDLISLGPVSAIHLHNAPAGENGLVVQDFIVDAGNPTGPALPFSVTEPVVEVDTLQSIEEFILSDDNDVFTATGAGSQTVFGGAGDDIIAGGGGTDFLDGGAGNDTNSFQGIGFDVVASLLDGTAQYGPVEETFVNFENLLGSDNDDSLTGDNEDNVLTGAAGADTLIGLDGDDTLVVDLDDIVIDGGEGSDTLDLSNLADGVRVDLDTNTPNPGPATQIGVIGQPEDGIEIVDIENVIGTSGDDTILGNNEINVLEGGAGDDSIHSFAGVDTIDGGEGIDTALFTAGPGVIVELDEDGSGQAFVNVDGEAGGESDFFFNFENVNGSASGNDILVGNQEDNNLFGNGGDDILTGGLGDDIIRGGEGSDTATFADLAADITAVDNGDGTVTVTTLTEGVDTLTDIEILLDGNGDTITVQPAAQETTDLSSAPADGPVFTPLSLENVGEVLFMSEDLEIFFAEDTAFGFEENINFDEDGAAIFVADVFEVA